MAYSYREVLKEPRALRVFGAALLGRLSFAMGPLALVLFVRAATGSFAVAGAASAMSGRGIRTLVISLTGFGAAVGIIDITLVAAAKQAGSASLGGVLLALLSAGGVVGGLWYGRRAWRLGAGPRYVRILALLALVSAALPLARPLPLLGLVVVAVGLLLAPLQSCAYVLAAELAPAGTMTEAATWVTTANNVTAAAGIALAGVLVGGPGVAWTLVVSWGCVAAAFLAALAGRGALLPSGSLAQQGTTESS